MILAHPSATVMRLADRKALERDLAERGSQEPIYLRAEYVPASGGAITLAIVHGRYGQDGLEVTVNWPGCGEKSPSDALAFFETGARISDLALQLRNLFALTAVPGPQEGR